MTRLTNAFVLAARIGKRTENFLTLSGFLFELLGDVD